MKKIVFIGTMLLLVFMLVLAGCGASNQADEAAYAPESSWPTSAPAMEMDSAEAPKARLMTAEMAEEAGVGGNMVIGERKVILHGNVVVDVEDIKESEDAIRQHLKGINGFIDNASFHTDSRGETMTIHMTIRLPQIFFDQTMLFLKEDLGKLVSKNQDSGDVTMQYVDMEARLNNLTRQETRYTEILEKAETVEEILQIERELVRIRGDIESLTAQFNHLKDRVDFSTITITLRQTILATPGVTAAGFDGAWERAMTALTVSLNLLINTAAGFFVFFFAALPFTIALLAVLLLAYTILKKRRQKEDGS